MVEGWLRVGGGVVGDEAQRGGSQKDLELPLPRLGVDHPRSNY